MSDSVRRILIADEDIEMRDLIGTQISQGYGQNVAIDQASHGREVLNRISAADYNLVIVNWALPEVSKTELLQKMRAIRNAAVLPVLVLVASSDAELVASVLEAGASDVLCKPFDRAFLLARVKSFLKNPPAAVEGKIVIGDLVLDTRTYDVYCGSNRVHLTPSEFKLLQALVEHRGAVMTREKLIERVQGEGIAVIDRAVDTHIFSLRKKLGSSAEMVQTVRGSGYRIKEN
jgi:two-component system phosphate regulon response regulator PhoB